MSMALLSIALVMATTTISTPPSFDTKVVNAQLRAGKGRWRVIDVRSGGVSRVDRQMIDAQYRRGALEQIIPAPGGFELSSEVELLSRDTVLDPASGLRPTDEGFGLLSELHFLELALYRDGISTTLPWLTSALRVYVYDPDLGVNGTSYTLIWEPIYNGLATGPNSAFPTDVWVFARVDSDFFWRTPLYIDGQRAPRSFCSENPNECFVFNRTIEGWNFGPRTVVFGLSLGVGAGWPGTYRGFVDDISLKIGDRSWKWDFARRRN